MTDKKHQRPKLIDRWWVRLLVAAWILAVVSVYLRLQLLRLLEITQVPGR